MSPIMNNPRNAPHHPPHNTCVLADNKPTITLSSLNEDIHYAIIHAVAETLPLRSLLNVAHLSSYWRARALPIYYRFHYKPFIIPRISLPVLGAPGSIEYLRVCLTVLAAAYSSRMTDTQGAPRIFWAKSHKDFQKVCHLTQYDIRDSRWQDLLECSWDYKDVFAELLTSGAIGDVAPAPQTRAADDPVGGNNLTSSASSDHSDNGMDIDVSPSSSVSSDSSGKCFDKTIQQSPSELGAVPFRSSPCAQFYRTISHPLPRPMRQIRTNELHLQ